MTAWIWALMFVCGLSVGIIVGLWVSQRRDQQHLGQLNQTLRESFSALSVEALERNAERQRDSLENTLKPLQETLERARKQIDDIEKDRHTAYGRLTQQLQDAVTSQEQLRRETQTLSQALARPQVRGSYGEVTLRRIIELAGMTAHVDFVEQEQQAGGGRPDVVVRLPENRVLPIDAKAPLQKYSDAYRESDPERQKALLREFAGSVRAMVTDLSRKEYWAGFASGNSLDFVVMFVPGDQFLNAALEQDPELMDDALQKKVLLATPSSLMAILRAVAYGWNQQKVAENAERIRKLGYELCERVAVFSEHMAALGKSLGGSVGRFNRMVGSWESRVLPTSDRFRELGVDAHKKNADVEELTQIPRHVTSSKDSPDDAG